MLVDRGLRQVFGAEQELAELGALAARFAANGSERGRHRLRMTLERDIETHDVNALAVRRVERLGRHQPHPAAHCDRVCGADTKTAAARRFIGVFSVQRHGRQLLPAKREERLAARARSDLGSAPRPSVTCWCCAACMSPRYKTSSAKTPTQAKNQAVRRMKGPGDDAHRRLAASRQLLHRLGRPWPATLIASRSINTSPAASARKPSSRRSNSA